MKTEIIKVKLVSLKWIKREKKAIEKAKEELFKEFSKHFKKNGLRKSEFFNDSLGMSKAIETMANVLPKFWHGKECCLLKLVKKWEKLKQKEERNLMKKYANSYLKMS